MTKPQIMNMVRYLQTVISSCDNQIQLHHAYLWSVGVIRRVITLDAKERFYSYPDDLNVYQEARGEVWRTYIKKRGQLQYVKGGEAMAVQSDEIIVVHNPVAL